MSYLRVSSIKLAIVSLLLSGLLLAGISPNQVEAAPVVQVRIVSPSVNATVAPGTTFEVSVSPNVVRVEYSFIRAYDTGVEDFLGTATKPPFSFTWQGSGGEINGGGDLLVYAYDRAGRRASATRLVKIIGTRFGPLPQARNVQYSFVPVRTSGVDQSSLYRLAQPNSFAEFELEASVAGTYDLYFRNEQNYSPRPTTITVNGSIVSTNFTLIRTITPNYPYSPFILRAGPGSIKVNLIAGVNRIRITAPQGNGPRFDSVWVSQPPF